MSFPDPEEPWRISDNVHWPSCAVSNPSLTLHPLARGKVPSALVVTPLPVQPSPVEALCLIS